MGLEEDCVSAAILIKLKSHIISSHSILIFSEVLFQQVYFMLIHLDFECHLVWSSIDTTLEVD